MHLIMDRRSTASLTLRLRIREPPTLVNKRMDDSGQQIKTERKKRKGGKKSQMNDSICILADCSSAVPFGNKRLSTGQKLRPGSWLSPSFGTLAPTVFHIVFTGLTCTVHAFGLRLLADALHDSMIKESRKKPGLKTSLDGFMLCALQVKLH